MINKRPLIGLTTYRKHISDDPYINIDGLMPTYTSAIAAVGGLPVMIPPTLNEEQLADLFDNLDGLLLPGGGDVDPAQYNGPGDADVYGVDPVRDRIELFLARRAVEKDKPLLAICRGHQVFNIAMGGSLWEDVLELRPNSEQHAFFRGYKRSRLSHEVQICDESRLASIFQREHKAVNSIHHQGIKRLGFGLTATAYAPDGLIEGIELSDHRFALGVQWHPEEFCHTDPETKSLFAAFVEAAKG